MIAWRFALLLALLVPLPASAQDAGAAAGPDVTVVSSPAPGPLAGVVVSMVAPC